MASDTLIKFLCIYLPPSCTCSFDWAGPSPYCSRAAEIFHFWLIRIRSNARNSICRCPSLYIGETELMLREHTGEHLQTITRNPPGFSVAPTAKHFNRPARFSKVPKRFRTRKAVAKSRTYDYRDFLFTYS